MGIDSYVYVGTFVRVPGVRKTVKNTSCRCSRGCGARPAAGAKFCAQCGSTITCIDTGGVELRQLHPGDVLGGKYENAFWMSEYSSGADRYEAIWMPHSRYGKSFGLRDGDCAMTLQVDSAKACAEFARSEQELLDAVQAEYGVTPVVCWGVVPYAS